MKKDSSHSNRKVEPTSGNQSQANSSAGNSTDRDGNDFVVSEASGRDVEFVGGEKEFAGSPQSKDSGAKRSMNSSDSMADHQQLNLDDEDIMPEQALGASAAEQSSMNSFKASPASQTPPDTKSGTNRKNGEGVKRLSTDQVKEIEKNLYSSKSELVSSKEKEELLKKVQTHLTGNEKPTAKESSSPARTAAPIVSDQDIARPTMAKKTRGIAYYYKNYIQIVGSIEMHDNDELIVNERPYALKRKRVSPQVGWGIGIGALAVVMLVFASLFIKDAGSGLGEVTGIVLDENSQPYVQGATVRFPDLGINVTSNPAGFFRSGDVPEGTHKIQYFVNGAMIGEDYATTINGDLTMVALRPRQTTENNHIAQAENAEFQQVNEIANQQQNLSMAPPQSQMSTRTESTHQTNETAASSTSSNLAKLTLAANVPQAKITLDGKVLGAGNMTFSKLKPGTKSYTISRDGYQDIKGSIKLVAGEEAVLSVNLEPVAETQKAAEYTTTDYFHSAEAARQAGDMNRAVQEYTQAIDQKPSYAEAYVGRGEANMVLNNKSIAHDDFVHAAEMFQMRGEYNSAATLYNRAIDADKKSVTAYLGRANLYLARGEQIAALADYESVVKLDKRNFAAHYGMGQARYQQGNYKNAIDHYKTARSINDSDSRVHQALVLCYMGTSDFKNMKKSWEKFEMLASENDKSQFRQNANYTAVMAALERN